MIDKYMENPYYEQALQEVQRLVSWQDREPFSITYGCFDRTYWCWKFTDFPGARFQEGIYALAHLYSHPFPGNTFAGNEHILTWIQAGMRYWANIQYGDGSFDEAYPFEHSLAATAFTSFYIGEALMYLRDKLPAAELEDIRNALIRSADWLSRNDERHGILSNHLAAAAASLCVTHQLFGETRHLDRCNHFLQRIYDHQSAEGWYEEYGGADPGYQTHATFYLARIWQLTTDQTLLNSLEKSVAFLKHFIHPNHTLGGEYASRNTEFYFPSGFEMLSRALPDAALIAHYMRPAVIRQTAAGLAAMDSYNFLPLLNNYLFAGKNTVDQNGTRGELPCQSEGETYFPDAGLFVKRTPTYYAVLGLSKGGTLRVYDRTNCRLLENDCGYWATLENKHTVSSQYLNRPGDIQRLANRFEVKTNFTRINQRVQKPWAFAGFRLFTTTLGRIQAVAYWIKSLLVWVLVRRKQSIPMCLTRLVQFEDKSINIIDHIELTGNIKVKVMKLGNKFSSIHMGSSRYYQEQELDLPLPCSYNWATDLYIKRSVEIKRTITTFKAESDGT